MTHYMIDIETLGTDRDCMVISIALVRFDEKEIIDSLVLYPDLQDQENKGRKIEIDTLQWWMLNKELLNQMIGKDRIRKSVSFCLNQISWFINHNNGDKTIWSKSPSFDLVILKNLFKPTMLPWSYTEEADVRTAEFKLRQNQIKLQRSQQAHDPLEDAIAQAQNVQLFLVV